MPRIKSISPKRTSQQSTKKTDSFYYSTKWRKLRAHKLSIQPLCEICYKNNVTTIATVVDHDKTRRLWPELEMDLDNLVPMCNKHHNKKRALEKNIHTQEDWQRVFDNHRVFDMNLGA